jgi:hypothetical protein
MSRTTVKWPTGDTPAYIEDIVTPVVKAIRFAFNLERKNENRSIPWSGPPIGRGAAANSLEAKTRLSAAMLRYSEENQGRDALDEIIGLAIQIGIEQGRRIYKDGGSFKTLMLRLGTYRMGMERLASMEAFETSRVIQADLDKELLARIDYARKFVALKQLDSPDDDDHD